MPRRPRLGLISIATLCVLAAGPVEAGRRLYDMGVFLTASDESRAAPASAGRAAAESAPEGLGGILSEVRIGVLKHDFGPFSSSEEHGIDVNLEFLFVAPDALEFLWSPRPHLGVTINTDDDTNQAYFGLSWEFDVWRDMFVGFSFGGSVHDGETETFRTDKKELGCKLLFRESVEVGWRLGDNHAITVFLDHVSNANICVQNEGLENFGMRYGYRF